MNVCRPNKLANRILFSLIFLFGSFLLTRASNLYTADVSYTCSGTNTYNFTVTLYRDCLADAAPNSVTLEFQSDSCGSSFTSSLSKDLFNVKEDSLVCDNSMTSTTCNGGTLWGIEEHYYTGTVIFPSQCPDWTISFDHFGRHDSLTNIKNTNNTGIAIRKTIDNTLPGPCNASAEYSSLPITHACAGQSFCYNIGAYDSDGDSIVVALTTPLDTSGEPVRYKNGYTFNQPISTISSSSFSLDQKNGALCFTPDTPQTGLVAFEVKTYRNDTLIATALRELFVIVDSCNNNTLPKADTPYIKNVSNGLKTNDKLVETCPGSNLSFDIPATDADGDNIKMTANNNQRIPGSNFNTSCSNCTNPTGTFNWTPPALGEYHFTVRLKDDHCDLPGYQFRTITIRVIDGTRALAERTNYCSSGDSIQLFAQGGTSFQWSPSSGLSCDTCANPKAAPTSPTTYTVTSNFLCDSVDSITIDTVPSFTLNTSPDTSICNAGDSVQLGAHATSSTPNSYTYEWTPAVGLTDAGIDSPKAAPPFTINYRVATTSDSGCVVEKNVRVDVSRIPEVHANSDEKTVCKGDSVTLQSIAFTTETIFKEDFEPGIDNNIWQSHQNVEANGNCSSISGDNSLWYGGTNGDPVIREIISEPVDIDQNGYVKSGKVNFFLKAGTCSYSSTCGSTCEDPTGFDMILKYSVNNGSWQQLKRFDSDDYQYYKAVSVDIPNTLIGDSSVRFMWQEEDFRYIGPTTNNNWVIDDIRINVRKRDTGAAFSWIPANGITYPTRDTTPAQVNQTTTYTATANSYGCKADDSVTVLGLYPQAFGDSSICRGDTIQIGAQIMGLDSTSSVIPSCGVNGTPCYRTPQNVQVGAGTNAYGYATSPYSDYYTSLRIQYLFKKSELQAAGITEGTITAMAFNIAFKETTNPISGFSIKMGCTNLQDFSNSGFVSGLQTVVSPHNYTTTSGWNTHQFDNTFDWDGQSNIIIEICYAGGSYNYDWDEVDYTQTSYTSVQYYPYGSSGCSSSYEYDNDLRPNIRFTYCKPTGLLWQQTAGLIDTAGSSVRVAPDTTTNFVVDLAGLCDPGDTVQVTVNSPVIQKDSVVAATCGNDNGQINVDIYRGTNPFTYQWDGPSQQTTQDADNLAPGTYTLTVSDSRGCIDTRTFTLDSIRQPNIQVRSVEDATCFNKSDGRIITKPLYGTPPYRYNWSNGDTSTNLNQVKASMYYVTLTDKEGCVTKENIKIGQPDQINILSMAKPVSAAGAGDGMAWVDVSGGTAPYTYEWNDGQQDDTARDLSIGTYTVTITDQNGCTQTKAVEITAGTGIVHGDTDVSFRLFPNPTDRQITTQIQLQKANDITIKGYNVLGEEIFIYTQKEKKQIQKQISFADQPSGVYFIKIIIGRRTFIRKVIIQK